MRKEQKMYESNVFSRRRQDGWSDRRRYYRRLFEAARPKSEREKPESKDSSKTKA